MNREEFKAYDERRKRRRSGGLRRCLRDRVLQTLRYRRALKASGVREQERARLLAGALWELWLAKHPHCVALLLALVAPLAMAVAVMRGATLRLLTTSSEARLVHGLALLGYFKCGKVDDVALGAGPH